MKKKYEIYTPTFSKEESNSLLQVIKSGWLTNGPKTLEFEKRVQKKLGTKNAIAVNSCTSGIYAALHALNLKRGDEIITTPLTFVSTIHNLYNFGLKVKLIDINMDDFSADLNLLKKNISKKTKCVLITHYGGIPTKINEIIKLCRLKKIKIIEDAATVLGAKLGKKNIGSFNDTVTVFSLHANKIITTGEGGIITTNNNRLAKKIRILISCGIDRDAWGRNFKNNSWKYEVSSYGFKFNFTDMQAALGLEQLKKLDKIQKYRAKLRLLYNNQFKELISKDYLKVQKVIKNIHLSEYIYTILLNEKKIAFKRDDLMVYLKKNNVDTTIHYIPANKIDFYKNSFRKFNLKNSNYVYRNIISLPFNNNLKYNDIIYISELIKDYIKKS